MPLEAAKAAIVTVNGETIIDITPTTATEEAVFAGRTFLGADGSALTGTLQVPLSYMANGGIAYIEKGCSTMHRNNLTNVIQKNGTDFPCITEDSLDNFDSFKYEDFNRKPVQGEYFLVHTLDKDLHIVSFLGQVTSLNDAAQTFTYAIVFMANDAEAETLQVVYSDADTSGATTSETKRPGNNGVVDLSNKTASDLRQSFLSSTILTFNARVFNRAPKENEYFSFVAKTKDAQLLSIFAQITEVPSSASTTYKYKILALPDTPIGFIGMGEHAEIFNNYADNKATGNYSHAEGNNTEASGNYSHAEGQKTQATGLNAHTEGGQTKADGQSSHAEGVATVANGHGSHTEGYFTEANGLAQHVEGRYNIADSVLTDQNSISNYIHIAGNGTSLARSNAHTLDWYGNAWFAGDVYVGSTGGKNKDTGSKILATEERVPLQYKSTPLFSLTTYAELLTAIQTADGYTNALVDNSLFNRPPILNERFGFTAITKDNRVVLCYATVTELNVLETLPGGKVRYNTKFKIKGAADVDLIIDTQEKERAIIAEEALAARITDIEDNKADYATKAEAQGYANEVKKAILTGESTDELKETYDTLVEIQAWIEGDGVNATELTTAIAQEESARKTSDNSLNTKITAVGTSLTQINALLKNMYGSSSVQEGVTVIANATNLEKEVNRAKTKEAELDTRLNNIAAVSGLGKRGSSDTAEIFNDYQNNQALGEYSHAEGYQTTAAGYYSHAEGYSNAIVPDYVGALATLDEILLMRDEVQNSFSAAIGSASHVEGQSNVATGTGAHAEGYNTIVTGDYSHAEGEWSAVTGRAAHAEGGHHNVTGMYAHAEGVNTTAKGQASHTEGTGTIATGAHQHVQGSYNIEDKEQEYIHIVGNGTSSKQSNAHTLDWQGNAWFAGDVYVRSTSGTNKDAGSNKLVTMPYIGKRTAGCLDSTKNSQLSFVLDSLETIGAYSEITLPCTIYYKLAGKSDGGWSDQKNFIATFTGYVSIYAPSVLDPEDNSYHMILDIVSSDNYRNRYSFAIANNNYSLVANQLILTLTKSQSYTFFKGMAEGGENIEHCPYKQSPDSWDIQGYIVYEDMPPLFE